MHSPNSIRHSMDNFITAETICSISPKYETVANFQIAQSTIHKIVNTNLSHFVILSPTKFLTTKYQTITIYQDQASNKNELTKHPSLYDVDPHFLKLNLARSIIANCWLLEFDMQLPKYPTQADLLKQAIHKPLVLTYNLLPKLSSILPSIPQHNFKILG